MSLFRGTNQKEGNTQAFTLQESVAINLFFIVIYFHFILWLNA